MRFWATTVALLVAVSAAAQVRNPNETVSAGEGAGSLSDVSGGVRDDSAPMYGSGTVGEMSVGTVRSGPMRGMGSRSMLSGPVSDASVGSMRDPRPPFTSGAVTESSAGPVKQNDSDPLGTQISEPIRELRPLQDAMRVQREQAEAAALTGVPAAALSPDQEAAMREQANRAAEEELEQLEMPSGEPMTTDESAEEPPAPAEGEGDALEEHVEIEAPAEHAPAPAENEPAAAEAADEAPAAEPTPHGGTAPSLLDGGP